ncbi:MAG TPA: hypothetical protein VF254_03685 [Gammaproteobacteria bacterium]
MIELLAALALLQAANPLEAPPAYRSETLSGFVAIENGRAVDGINYGNNEGLLSAGLIYAHSNGFFAGGEWLFSHGDGNALPDAPVRALHTFAGYARTFGSHRFAVELLDYRLDAGDSRLGHQGIGLRYRYGAFEAELAHERDRPYYYAYRDRFFRYDADRLVVGWRQDLGSGLYGSLGIGASKADRIGSYRFITAGLHGRFGKADWQLGYTYAGEDIEGFYGGIDREQWLLRLAMPFRIL